MNIQNILTEIEKTDPEVYERMDSRRGAMQSFLRIGGKLALAAIPIALGGMFKKAYGQSAPNIVAVLNYALTLEYLEAEFYTMGAASGVVPAGTPGVGAINTIRDHENAHVSFLKTAIASLGGQAVAKPTFDFTAGGAFGNVFTNYDTFLAVAQTFEDTGVRAYKGRAGELMGNNDVLTAALQIHSVEARHASHIRQMRKARGANVKPWITGKDTGGIGAAVQASYNGEELTTQAGIDIAAIVNANAASESFDEPLTAAQVLAIVDPFIV
ncbi:ferritin-like domain-containing protein [Chitinophaga barathri]|uniref:Ferritin-like domain-containing protein n=1 Tax=Chitinophaga barathri TaxID=1647451 RepID=A0A3N4MCM7_9BACT|nr:ferritin-like domain-containing protein [Chitinophaga barathri]RPD41461.1 ferritin-like domain-containing protein [Chitinophaga barathri]